MSARTPVGYTICMSSDSRAFFLFVGAAVFTVLLVSPAISNAACRAATPSDITCLRNRGITLARAGMVCDADEIVLRQNCRATVDGDLYRYLLDRLVEPHRTQRPYYVSDLDPAFAKCLADFMKEAEADGITMEIFSGARNAADQARARAQSIARRGAAQGSLYAAAVGSSPHQRGIAVDLKCNGGSNCAPLVGTIALRHGVDFPLMPGKPRGSRITEPWHLEPNSTQCTTAGFNPAVGGTPPPAAAAPAPSLLRTLGTALGVVPPAVPPPAIPSAALPQSLGIQQAFAPPVPQPVISVAPVTPGNPGETSRGTAPVTTTLLPDSATKIQEIIAPRPSSTASSSPTAYPSPNPELLARLQAERAASYTPIRRTTTDTNSIADKSTVQAPKTTFGEGAVYTEKARAPLYGTLSSTALASYRQALQNISIALHRLLEVIRGRKQNTTPEYQDAPEWDL